MQAVTVRPGVAGSTALEEVPEPERRDGWILARSIAVGVCGTDLEIVRGEFGASPPGCDRLVLGHESLAEVLEAPAGSGFVPGDWIAGIVRRPDPVPCLNCAVGEWDMCRNGLYTERGVKGLDGFGSERFVIEPSFAVPVDRGLGLAGVLTEPASVLAKAWEHVEKVTTRSRWRGQRVLVTGAGPIGLLAALMGIQRGLEVHVLDRVTGGPKPEIVRALGATYHAGPVEAVRADVVLECTGQPTAVQQAIEAVAPSGVVCLVGLGRGEAITTDLAALNQKLVLDNNVVFGSVNANRRHWQMAALSLAQADRGWLDRLITRQVPLDRWSEALVRRPDDVKPVIVFAPELAPPLGGGVY
jgi:threonine dehydrogenase-like Zn-dependent dehydrogenase